MRSQHKVTIALLDIFSQNENNEDNILKKHKLDLCGHRCSLYIGIGMACIYK